MKTCSMAIPLENVTSRRFLPPSYCVQLQGNPGAEDANLTMNMVLAACKESLNLVLHFGCLDEASKQVYYQLRNQQSCEHVDTC